jgi:hypothetical protein
MSPINAQGYIDPESMARKCNGRGVVPSQTGRLEGANQPNAGFPD